jgi:hypothetical protein
LRAVCALDGYLRIRNKGSTEERRAAPAWPEGISNTKLWELRGPRQQDWPALQAALCRPDKEEIAMTLGTILIIILILILIGALPTWGYSSGWGYGPGGIVGLILIVVIILALMGRL